MRVGFAGVGRMGQPVCANLVRAGYVVTAGDVRAELESMVAGWGGASAEVAAEAEVLITMLPAPRNCTMSCSCPAVRWQPCPAATWIDMTSTSPTAGKLLAEAAEARRIGVLDAPVGGGIPAAEAGTLQMFVGRDAERRNPSRQGTIRRTPRYWEIPQRPAQTPGLTGLDAAKPRTPGTLATSPA